MCVCLFRGVFWGSFVCCGIVVFLRILLFKIRVFTGQIVAYCYSVSWYYINILCSFIGICIKYKYFLYIKIKLVSLLSEIRN